MEKTRLAVSSQKSCLECRFCDTSVSLAAGQTVTLCRFRPPVAVAMLVNTPNGLGWQQFSTWPQVTSSDWCAEYRAKLSS